VNRPPRVGEIREGIELLKEELDLVTPRTDSSPDQEVRYKGQRVDEQSFADGRRWLAVRCSPR
jgi:hypothetical protein